MLITFLYSKPQKNSSTQMVLLCCQILSPKFDTQNPKPTRETESRGDQRTNKVFKLVHGNQWLKEPIQLSSHNQSKLNSTITPSSYGPLLKSCSKERSLSGGLQLHAHMMKTGFQSKLYLQANLLNLYIKCKSLGCARKVFDAGNLRSKLISWNSIITVYCQLGLIEEALPMFLELQRSGLGPDQFTFSSLIGIIEEQSELSLGRQLHSLSVKFGYAEEEFVANSLIQMYALFGRIDDSICVFEGISSAGSPVAWNSMIARLVENEIHEDGLKLYEEMQCIGILPTPATLSSVLKACGAIEAIWEGKQVHAQVTIHGFLPNMILETALLDFYLKCEELDNGRMVFEKMEKRNAFSWNSLIRGYSYMDCRVEALKLFQLMRRELIIPDKFTFPALLSGFTNEKGGYNFPQELRSVHGHILKAGLETDKFIATSLITMYSKNQSLEEARLVFFDADSKDTGVWSSMISASINSGESEEALVLFTEMLHLEIKPNPFIFSSSFMACSNLSALETGKQIHGYSLKNFNSLDIAAQNSLLTMYSNCGFITNAWMIFDSLPDPSVVSFNSMISALAQHGLPNQASELFQRMKLAGLKPDKITLLHLLSAFNHAGLVENGLQLFSSMEKVYGVEPTYQHYACTVDLLARGGEIEQAIELIDAMPFDPEPSLWQVVLGACGKHRNIGIGRRIAEKMIELEPYEATNYVLFANIYARLGNWVEADKIRKLMKERGIAKEEGASWIEIKRRIYKFGVEERTHPRSEEIYKKLHELMKDIKAAGYEADTSFTLHDMEEERREQSLWYHGEKLAFAFGIISTEKGTKLRITKNLRVCGDCHCAFKYFSMVTGREIVLKDKYRFHHFSSGECSCGDYW